MLMVLLGLLVLLAAAGGYLYYRATVSLPETDGTAQLPGLTQPVEVLRDRYGVAHVYASSLEDLARATGYVHAQDRLFQMEMARRLGTGTMAEILGASLVPFDRQIRLMGLAHAAQAELQSIAPEARTLLEAYAEGVNTFIDTHLDRLPPEFQLLGIEPEPWQPLHTLAIGKWMAYLLSFNRSVELLRAHLTEKLGEEAAYTLTGLAAPAGGRPAASLSMGSRLPRFEAPRLPWMSAGGSNAWAVSGLRTASGKPLLASDPHLPLPIPSLWYEIHLAGGGLNVTGASLPGVPLVLIGHNERIAWGVTASFADVQDLYVERVNPENPRQVASGDQWEDIEVYPESIAVHEGAPVQLEVQRTRHGVIVYGTPRDGKVLALRWDGLWSGDAMLGFLRLNQAGDWDEFLQSLSWLGSLPLSFVYADTEGNIGWCPSGDIPLRSGFDGSAPVDGSSGTFEWQGFVPPEAKPVLLNPEEGYIVSANHKMIEGETDEGFGRDQLAPYRAERITSLLATAGPLRAADFARIQADRYDPSTEPILRYLVALEPDSDETGKALLLLRKWDGQMRAGPAGAIYQAFLVKLLESTFRDELGEDLFAEYLEFIELGYRGGIYSIIDDAGSSWWDDQTTPAVEDREAILKRSLSAAVAWLTELQGGSPDEWDWARLNGVVFEHPLGRKPPLSWLFNRGPVPFGGSVFTIANARVSLTRPFRVVAGTSFRMVVDLADLNASTSTLPTGASGHPLSLHYFDQNARWLQGTNHPLLFDRSRIEEALEAELTLAP